MMDINQIKKMQAANTAREKWSELDNIETKILKRPEIFKQFISDCLYYKENSAGQDVIKVFSTIFTDKNKVIEIIKFLQEKPIYLADTIYRIATKNKSLIDENTNFFKTLIMYSLSSLYSLKRVNIKDKIKALCSIRDLCRELSNDNFSFKEIINKIIYNDYACGYDLCFAEQSIAHGKEKDYKIVVGNNTDTDADIISNIITSKEYVDNNKQLQYEVLAYFQNIENNKLFFSANVKNPNLDGKTLTEVIVDNFLSYLDTKSIQRLLSTVGLYDEVKYNLINNQEQKIKYENYYRHIIDDHESTKDKIKVLRNYNNDFNGTLNSLENCSGLTFSYGLTAAHNINVITNDGRSNPAAIVNDTDNRYDPEYNKKIIEKIILSQNFKNIDFNYKLIDTENIDSNFEVYKEGKFQKKNLKDKFFENFETNNIKVIYSITNTTDFILLEERNISTIFNNLVQITEERPEESVRVNNKQSSIIIECAKKLYFHPQASEKLKNDIIEYVSNVIESIRDTEDKHIYVFGNSLIEDSKEGIRTTSNSIKINDFEFLKKILENIKNNHISDDKKKEHFSNILSSAIHDIEYPRVFTLLMTEGFFTERKIVEESLVIFDKKKQNLINFWNESKENFLKSILRYINLNCTDDFEENLKLLLSWSQQKFQFSRPIEEKPNKKIINNAILAKGLADGLKYIDIKDIYLELSPIINDTDTLYNKINKFGNLDFDEENKLNRICLKLKQSVLDQLKYFEQFCEKQILKSKDNYELKKIYKLLSDRINYVKFQIENQAYEDFSSNGYIKQKITGLNEHFQNIRKTYNQFKKHYNNIITLEKYEKESKDKIKNTKHNLIKNIKNIVEKKQKEWNDAFVLNRTKNSSELNNYFYDEYNSIDNYASQILDQIAVYEGTDIESLQKQTKKTMEILNDRILKFDAKIKKDCKIANEFNKNISDVATLESNISYSDQIIKNKDIENEKKKYKNEISNATEKKKNEFLKEIKPQEKRELLFDNKQVAITSVGTAMSIGTLIFSFLYGMPIVGYFAIGLTAIEYATLYIRKKKNDKVSDFLNADSEFKIYEATFEKKGETKYIKNKNDIESEQNEKKSKQILKKVKTNLDTQLKQLNIS